MNVEKKELTGEQAGEAIKLLITSNSIEFNALKVIEEFQEAGMLLTKFVTKSQKPTKEELVEELGDVMVRMVAFVEHYDVVDQVIERANSKLAYLYEYLKDTNNGTTITVTRKNNS